MINQSEELPPELKALDEKRVGRSISLAVLAKMSETERESVLKEFSKPVPGEREAHIQHLEAVCAAFEEFIGCSYDVVCQKIRDGEAQETWPICIWGARHDMLGRLKGVAS